MGWTLNVNGNQILYRNTEASKSEDNLYFPPSSSWLRSSNSQSKQGEQGEQPSALQVHCVGRITASQPTAAQQEGGTSKPSNVRAYVDCVD